MGVYAKYNVYWCDLRVDMILLQKWLYGFWYVLRNDVFIDQLICVKMYDMAKMIYGNVLRKEFHTTSLSLLDLRFKISSSRIKCLGQVEKKVVEGLAASRKSY